MTPLEQRRRRRAFAAWVPRPSPIDFEYEKRRAEGVMGTFDKLPEYLQNHIRETNTVVGAVEPPPGMKQAYADIKAVVGWSASSYSIKNWSLDIDDARQVMTLSVNEHKIDLFTRDEIEDMSYRMTAQARIRKLMEDS